MESNMGTYITICKIESQKETAIWLSKLKQGLGVNPEGQDGVGDGREVQKEGTYVYLWLIHVEIWQKTTKFCKAIILQLKKKKRMTVKPHEDTLFLPGKSSANERQAQLS